MFPFSRIGPLGGHVGMNWIGDQRYLPIGRHRTGSFSCVKSGTRAAMLELSSGEIHLWLAMYDEIASQSVYSDYIDLMSPEERLQERRFYFERDRQRYRVTRALVRTVLSRYLSPCPEEWRFAVNQYGRPSIANQCAGASELRFNISHTHSLIVVAVANNRELGVDVENIHCRAASIEIAEQYFSPTEVIALRRAEQARQQHLFFELWTFKEAYIKARGMGLFLPLDKFSLHFPHDRGVQIAIDPDLEDSASRWRLWQLRPTVDHLMAVCAEREIDTVDRLVVKKVVPMLSEETLILEPSRASEMAGNLGLAHEGRKSAKPPALIARKRDFVYDPKLAGGSMF
jgi:4'-phosphopantetheinyl transferase